MPNMLYIMIAAIVLMNVVFAFFYFYKPVEPAPPSNVTLNETPKQITPTNISLINDTICLDSVQDFIKNIENITNATKIETRIFNKSVDVTKYLERNWTNLFYEINGTRKDISNITIVSIVNVTSNRGRNFILPILCDNNGKIGSYSSCLLNNIPNIPLACYNLTINLTDCEIEWRDHTIMDDIEYWVTPLKGAIVIGPLGYPNKTQLFNFTIKSSRNRIESYGMNIIERTFRPIINDDLIFSSTKFSTDGKGGTIKTTVNVTGKVNEEFYATVWFIKKCYDKYVIY